MNIEQLQSDALSMTLSLTLEALDYSDRVKKSLNDLRRKAEIKGFRKGMVPMGIIQKMYGHTSLLEEVNKLIFESLEKYLNDNHIKIIGEPLPNEEYTRQIDWDRDQTFTFAFDLILTPKVDVSLSAEDHISIKEVKITKKDKDEYVESLRKEYGRLLEVEAVESEDLLSVDLKQDDKSVNDSFIVLRTISLEDLKHPFLGLKVGDAIEIDLVKTFPNPSDRAALLKVKKEELDDTNPIWQVTVLKIKRFAPAPLDQEFFDKLFGQGVVETQESLIKKVEEKMKKDAAVDCDYRFSQDAREYLINKCAIELPDPLLKRWLHLINDGKISMEEIERDYNAFAHDFRWQLIRGYYVKENNITISKDEMMFYAMRMVYHRFASYGYHDAPLEDIEKFAKNILANEKEYSQVLEMAQDEKVFAIIRSSVTLDPEKISFKKLMSHK